MRGVKVYTLTAKGWEECGRIGWTGSQLVATPSCPKLQHIIAGDPIKNYGEGKPTLTASDGLPWLENLGRHYDGAYLNVGDVEELGEGEGA